MKNYYVFDIYGSYLISQDKSSEKTAREALIDATEITEEESPKVYPKLVSSLDEFFSFAEAANKKETLSFTTEGEQADDKYTLSWKNATFDGTITMYSYKGENIVHIHYTTNGRDISKIFSKKEFGYDFGMNQVTDEDLSFDMIPTYMEALAIDPLEQREMYQDIHLAIQEVLTEASKANKKNPVTLFLKENMNHSRLELSINGDPTKEDYFEGALYQPSEESMMCVYYKTPTKKLDKAFTPSESRCSVVESLTYPRELKLETSYSKVKCNPYSGKKYVKTYQK